MDSRERVYLALTHQTPDRVPWDYWAVKEVDRRLLAHYALPDREALLDRLDVDLRYIEGPRYIGPPLKQYPDGSIEDLWGVPRRTVAVGSTGAASQYEHVTRSPLAACQTVQEIREYPRWPSPDWYDYSGLAAQCARHKARGRAVVFMGDRLNRIAQWKPIQYLRGMERSMEDMLERPDIFHALAGKLAGFYVEYLRRILEAARGGIDIVFMGDDFGMQDRMLCSPGMWREFLAPGLRRFIETAKPFKVFVAQHTDGAVGPIIGDMVAMGLDVLNPVQPGVQGMEPEKLKQAFGDRLSFHGSICIQKTLPFGTPAEIRAEVLHRVKTLGRAGGLILCSAHNIQSDTPTANILALFEAYRELGVYA